MSHLSWLGDKLSFKLCAMEVIWRQAWSVDPTIYRLALSPDNDKNEAQAAIHTRTLQAKNILKYY